MPKPIKVEDKFIIRINSREKGKVGTGLITMNLRYDLPYEYLAEIIAYLEKYGK